VDPPDQPGPPGSARPRGRRPAAATTREALLTAARQVFSELGYTNASVRVIAERANQDAAMINYWFGGKNGLFRTAMATPPEEQPIVTEQWDAHPAQLGEQVTRAMLTRSDWPGEVLMGLLRSCSDHPDAAAIIRDRVNRGPLGQIARIAAPDQHELRAALCAAQAIGLAITSQVLKPDPLAAAGHNTLLAALAPTMQRYLTAPLDP